VGGKKENKWKKFDIFNVMTKSKISFQSIRQYSRFIWEVTRSDRPEANSLHDSFTAVRDCVQTGPETKKFVLANFSSKLPDQTGAK
jgi:hypothetical protein